MQLIKTAAAAALTIGLVTGAQASSLSDTYDSFWVLGDSLSDDGSNVVKATNGDVWNEVFLDEFGEANSGNYAYSGATAGRTRIAGVPLEDPADPTQLIKNNVTDLFGQVTELLTTETASFGGSLRPLVSIWIGGNDPGAWADGEAEPFDTFRLYTASIAALIDAGVRDFLVFEVPNIGFTPELQGDVSGKTEDDIIQDAIPGGAAATLVNQQFAAIRSQFNATFTLIETFDLTQTAFFNPEFFGVERRGPCLDFSKENPFIDNCDETAFWDSFHPTEPLHQFVTEQVRDAYGVSEIPLPASAYLLIAGLGGLGLMRRRAA